MKKQIHAEIARLKREGSLLVKRLDEYAEELRQDGRNISDLKTTRFWGWVLTGGAAILLITTFIINHVIFSGFGGFASSESAIGVGIATFIGFTCCIFSFNAWYYQGSQKNLAGFIISSLVVVSLTAVQIFLGYVRGGFVEEVSFIKPGLLSFLFPLLTIGSEFGGAIALHDGLERILSTSRPLKLRKEIRKGEQKLIQIAYEIDKLKGEIEGSEDIAEEEANERKRVLKKLGIALLAIAVILVYAGFSLASESECRGILIDLSLSSSVKDRSNNGNEFEKNISTALGIIRAQEKSGRVFVVGITDESFSNPMIIINRSLPQPGLFGEKLEFEKRKTTKELQAALKNIKPFSKKTDVFGALSLTKDLFGQSCQDKRLFILSDMRHAARGIDIGNISLVPPGIVTKAAQRGMLPRLDGVKVVVGGVHTIGKDERYMESLKRFWEAYFKKAGADLQAFTTIR